jgi:2Fe-2S ferredoxin
LTKVIFVDRQGGRHEIEADNGVSIMEVAMNNGIPGIYAECGGTCSCATCHCFVAEAWVDKLTPMDDLEDGMLDGAKERRPTSRLTCQIIVNDALDGIELEVADNNL